MQSWPASMAGLLELDRTLGEVEARATALRRVFSPERARSLEAALEAVIETLDRKIDSLDGFAKKRQARDIQIESAALLQEIRAVLSDPTQPNLSCVFHRTATWMALSAHVRVATRPATPGMRETGRAGLILSQRS